MCDNTAENLSLLLVDNVLAGTLTVYIVVSAVLLATVVFAVTLSMIRGIRLCTHAVVEDNTCPSAVGASGSVYVKLDVTAAAVLNPI